ncbi:hypothetical protein, partial [Pseudomonas sp.]|uniref:hypothetical protein n=1 Tax=Pseudomonas sp. TaxID=306 RepID=UPI003FD820D7
IPKRISRWSARPDPGLPCHAPDLRAHADSTALVSTGNGIAFDKLMAFFYLRFKQWTHRIIFWVK